MILPLTNTARSRELLAALPSSLFAAIAPRGGNSYNITANAHGATLDDVQAAAQSALNEAFSRARTSARRAGTVITGTVG